MCELPCPNWQVSRKSVKLSPKAHKGSKKGKKGTTSHPFNASNEDGENGLVSLLCLRMNPRLLTHSITQRSPHLPMRLLARSASMAAMRELAARFSGQTGAIGRWFSVELICPLEELQSELGITDVCCVLCVGK